MVSGKYSFVTCLPVICVMNGADRSSSEAFSVLSQFAVFSSRTFTAYYLISYSGAHRISVMLSRLSSHALKRTTIKNSATRCVAGASRNFVQPSGADRASVVDVPSNYQDDNHFAPRQGGLLHI